MTRWARNATSEVKLRLVCASAAMVLVLIGGCGTESTSDASEPSDAASSSAGTPPTTSDCPLTEQQASQVLDTTVIRDEGSCMFHPADEPEPNLLYNPQMARACADDGPASLGYTTQQSGLGVDAYLQAGTASGTMVLVCADQPFEITVDIVGDPDAALRAATTIAGQLVSEQ